MKAIPPTEFPLPSPEALRDAAPDICALQWQALLRAGAAVARLAGLDGETPSVRIASFPETVAEAGGWRFRVARQGIADLAAVMEPGLTALIAVHAGGADPEPAARALLQEFIAARDALVTLVPID